MKKAFFIALIGILCFSLTSFAQNKWIKVRSTGNANYYVDSTSIKPNGTVIIFQEMGMYKAPKSINEKAFIATAKRNNKAKPSTKKKSSKQISQKPVSAEQMGGYLRAVGQSAGYSVQKELKNEANLKKQAQVWKKPFSYYISEKKVNCKTNQAYTGEVTTYNTNKQVVSSVKYSDIGVPYYKEDVKSGSVNYWIMNKYCKGK